MTDYTHIKPLKKCPKTGERLSEEQLKWLEAMEYHFPKKTTSII